MVSDNQIIKRLHQLLKVSDLNVTTEKSIRLQLESEFSLDLSERRKFLREEIQKYLNGRVEEAEEQAEKKKGKRGEKRPRKRSNEGAHEGEERKRGGGGLMKMCSLSKELADFLGVAQLPRTEVVKGIWNYIRGNGLQDPSNKRVILCDDRLRHLLGTDSTDMFQLNKLLTVHIHTIPTAEGEAPQKKPKAEGSKGGGLAQPLALSDALVNFFQTGERALPRSEVVKRLWAYIKEHDLQDPNDRRTIICDDALGELLGVDRFNGFGMTKLLSPHFGKQVEPETAGRPADHKPEYHGEDGEDEHEGDDESEDYYDNQG